MKLYWILIGWQQWILRIVRVRTFLWCSEKRQNFLIAKNASIFLGLQNEAKKWDDLGCVVDAMEISSRSYKYLGRFADYCELKKVDLGQRLKQYAP